MSETSLPTSITAKVIASLSLAQKLALYGLNLESFMQENLEQAKEPEDEKNYTYGNFFADLHGKPEDFRRKVKDYAERIVNEGWEPIWWHLPIVRPVNSGGMTFVDVVTVRIRARRLRKDVMLKRQ